MHNWQPREIPSQAGRVAVVTGANSGIGFHAARHLAEAGCTVVLACRSREKGERARLRIARSAPVDCVRVALLDLADLDSVHAFAAQLLAEDRPLDLLINNAGVMALPARQTTRQGFELQFGTNYLGHFALTGLLLPALLRAPGSRIVTVSSIAHKSGKLDFDDLQAEQRYSGWKAYRQSKLADLMFGRELDRRLKAAGSTTESIVAHPGVAPTRLFPSGPGSGNVLRRWIGSAGIMLVSHSEDRGSWPLLYAATSPEAQGGHYYGPDGWREMKGTPVEVQPEPQALDQDAAMRLWTVGESLTGVHYTELETATSERAGG